MLSILSHQKDANYNNSEIPSYICKNGQHQKHRWQLMLERMWGKGNPPPLLEGYKLVQPLWISVWQFLRKLGNSTPQDPAIPLLGIYPKDASSYHKDMCSTMFIAALFIIVSLEITFLKTQQYYFWVYTQRMLNHTTRTCVQLCSQQHYLS